MSQHSGRSGSIVQLAHRGPRSQRDEGVVSDEVAFTLISGEAVPTIDGILG